MNLKKMFLKLKSKSFVELLSLLVSATFLRNFFKIKQPNFILNFSDSAFARSLWANSSFSNKDYDAIQAILDTNKIESMIDVGANIGNISLYAASNSQAKVFAIEANLKTFSYLQKNINLNKMEKSISAHNVAIGDKVGTIMFENKRSDDMNSVAMSSAEISNNPSVITVPITTLDDLFLDKLKSVDLLKIDIEGYELFALKGAKEILKKTKIIFFESYESQYNKFDYGFKDIFRLLDNSGFVIKNSAGDILGKDYVSVNCENLLAYKK